MLSRNGLCAALCVTLLGSATSTSTSAQAASKAQALAEQGGSSNPTVTLDQGVYVGTTTQLSTATPVVNKWLGIPFSDKLERFDPPRKPPNSKTVTQANFKAPSCIQQYNYPDAQNAFIQSLFNNPPKPESEDCLYLDVYCPVDANGSTAVMFWVLPGAFQFGFGTDVKFDGTNYAAKHGVCTVTANQRTNVFGYPGQPPDVPADARNLGMQDLFQALYWTQDNIAKFGGDPDKVTIFGESSGAVAVDYCTLALTDDPPFRAAIMESGTAVISPASGYSYSTLQPTLAGPPWPALASRLGCSGSSDKIFQCVKAADANQIRYFLEHDRIGFAQAVVDNYTIYSDLLTRRQNGKVAKVPILVGSNWQEFRLFIAIALISYFPSLNPLDNVAAALSFANESIQRLLPNGTYNAGVQTYYPTANLPILPLLDVIAEIGTDLTFNCPASLTANASANIGVPTWRYLYNATFPNCHPFLNSGVFHASEVPQVWQNYVGGIATPLIPPTAQELALSDYMMTAWSTFAKNPQRGPGWTQYAASGAQIIGGLGNGSRGGTSEYDILASVQDERCQVLNPIIEFLNSVQPPYIS